MNEHSRVAGARLSVATESDSNPKQGVPSVSPSSERDGAQPKLHALLAEDNRADVRLVEESVELYRVPIELHVVEDGEKAIQFIEQAEHDPAAPCPEIFLLDLNLPKRSGMEVLQRIRQSERFKHIPVLIVTSSDSPRDRAATARLGANRYFRKPANYDEFLLLGEVLNDLLAEGCLGH